MFMANCIHVLQGFEQFCGKSSHTGSWTKCKGNAQFVEMFDKFFDCMNWSSLSAGKRTWNPFKSPFRSATDWKLKVCTSVCCWYTLICQYGEKLLYLQLIIHTSGWRKYSYHILMSGRKGCMKGMGSPSLKCDDASEQGETCATGSQNYWWVLELSNSLHIMS